MCGLGFVIRFDGYSARKKIRKIYFAQKSRGTSGYGYVSVEDGKVTPVARATYEKDIMELLDKEESSTILFHHRTPTSTPNIVESTHPIVVSNPLLGHDYYVIHNGVITNTEKLKAKHEKDGFSYTTELKKVWLTPANKYYEAEVVWNDSESLAIEAALAIEGLQDGITTEGSVAFIAYQVEKGSQKLLNVFYGRNYSNPLTYTKTNALFYLASEGGSERVDTEKLYKFDYLRREITDKFMRIGDKNMPARSGFEDRFRDDTPNYPIWRSKAEKDKDKTTTISLLEEAKNKGEDYPVIIKSVDEAEVRMAVMEDQYFDLLTQLKEMTEEGARETENDIIDTEVKMFELDTEIKRCQDYIDRYAIAS